MLFPINLDFDGNYIKISLKKKKKNPYSFYSSFKKNLWGSPVIDYGVLAWGQDNQLLKSKGEAFIAYYSESELIK